MVYEINLCCPYCGAYEWEKPDFICTERPERDAFTCTECGERSTPAQMEPHYFET